MPGVSWFRRGVAFAGWKTHGAGVLATTKGLAATTSVLSTDSGPSFRLYFKTSGTIVPFRVVKLSSAGNIRHTTGTSGRRAFAVALTSASTAQVSLFGINFLMASSLAIKRGSLLIPSSGSVQTSRFNGGCVKAVPAAPATTIAHGMACGWAITSAAASSVSVRKVLAFFTPLGRYSTGV